MNNEEDIENAESNEKKKLSAKTISKIFKFVSTAGLVTCAVLKWLGVMPNATEGGICMIWSVAYGLGAGTIDLNVTLDKFLGNNDGSSKRDC